MILIHIEPILRPKITPLPNKKGFLSEPFY
jgi:hypothetical protein